MKTHTISGENRNETFLGLDKFLGRLSGKGENVVLLPELYNTSYILKRLAEEME